jgi:hypothetical protein
MRTSLHLIFACAAVTLSLNSQTTQLNQSFTAPFAATSNGWFIQNNSSPAGPATWAQGVGTIFPAFSGSANDYYCVNFNSQGTNFGDISNFLVTPTVSLMNGGILKFYSRTVNNPTSYPDRLEVLMSFGTGTGNIGSSVFSVGTFTSQLIVINPNLSSSGYPNVWTQYTTTLSSISGTITGRFAFRYDVPDGGPNGNNSDYIGIDDVTYTTAPPCPTATVSISPVTSTVCQGQSVMLAGSGATSYTWVNGPGAQSIVVNPASTTVYTITGSNPGGCPGAATATVFVVPFPVISASNVTACPNGTVSLSASGAQTYSWSNGATGSPIVVTANGPAVYTVTGTNGPGCSDTRTLSVGVYTFLTVSGENVVACPGQPHILGAAGAAGYSWSTGATTPSIVVTPTANGTYVVTGTSAGCSESKVITVIIDPNLFAPSFTTCAGTSATLVATGASSVSWSTGSSATMIVVSPTANTIYTVTGTSGQCSQTRTVGVTLGNNLSVMATQTCIGTTAMLTAYGASSYTWYPINDYNSIVFVNPVAPTVYTLAGTSGSCSGTRTIEVSVCVGLEESAFEDEKICLFPNPFTHELNIRDLHGELQLYSLTGQRVMSAEVNGSAVLETVHLGQGIYFAVISRKGSSERKAVKLIKE